MPENRSPRTGRIILATRGTLGDHLPVVGLGVALQRRGFHPAVACNPSMHGLVRRAGLEALAWGDALGATEAGRSAADWDHWGISPAEVHWTQAHSRDVIRLSLQLLSLARHADLLITAANLPHAALLTTALGIPWVEAGLNPGSCIDYERHLPEGADPHEWQRGVAQTGLDLAHALGLPEAASKREPLLRLHAVPAEVVPRDYPQKPAVVTGFWHYEDPLWSAWEAPAWLAALVEEPKRPLALALSSQPLADPHQCLSVHREAAALLGRTLLVPGGWAFSSPSAPCGTGSGPEGVHRLDSLPYAWLFRHVDAAFIHGGFGTLATGLAAGCPLVVEPLGNDQFLNARYALRSGRGLAVHPHRLDGPSLAAAIHDLWRRFPPGSPPPAWAREGSKEAGLAIAVDAIEHSWLSPLA